MLAELSWCPFLLLLRCLLRSRRRLHWRIAESILFMMIIGLLIAPYFQAMPLNLRPSG
ncbi:MAG TPA: hypothetical protein VMT34_06520 [Aggregatilineales bacterium]|nr:hypothetical protein [Aggregatilineales bacterium]